jgi:hypothetical protein
MFGGHRRFVNLDTMVTISGMMMMMMTLGIGADSRALTMNR